MQQVAVYAKIPIDNYVYIWLMLFIRGAHTPPQD